MGARSSSQSSTTVLTPADRARTETLWYDPDAAWFDDRPLVSDPDPDPGRSGGPGPTTGRAASVQPAPSPAARARGPSARTATAAGVSAPAATGATVGELARQALTDPLTGLGNRAALLAALSRRFGRPVAKRPLVVVAIDLDGLRETNLRHGRAAGDELLRRYAMRLAATVRVGDVVARTGGDEFIVLCDGPLEAGRALAARLTGSSVERRAAPASRPGLTACIGLAARRGRERSSTLLRRADAAARAARAVGRCQVVEAV